MEKIKKAWNYYQSHGLKLFLLKTFFPYQKIEFDYEKWRSVHAVNAQELKNQTEHLFDNKIVISIAVPVYHTPEKFLRAMIESVLEQSYSSWELCIADGSENLDSYHIIREYAQKDSRIKINHLTENKGIAGNTNEALRMCNGEYIGLLDHDDILALDALYEIRCAIDKHENPDIIYTDEDKMSMQGNTFFEPHFKLKFNRELLRSNNYICHFFVVKKNILERVKGMRREYDGAQDYDFILRCTECANSIIHIAKPLYHWRTHQSSTSSNPESKLYAYESGKRAIEDHLSRCGEMGKVEYTDYLGFYHVKYSIKKNDRITVIIIKNKEGYLKSSVKRCKNSIKRTCEYSNYHFLVVDQLSNLQTSDIEGKYVLLVNSAILMITQGWMREMLGNCQRFQVGAVGGKLYNRNETIRHAGIIQKKKRYAFEGLPRVKCGYFHRDSIMQNMSAVTIDFMMIPSEILLTIESEFSEFLGNERKMCYLIRKMKKEIVYDPGIEAYFLGKSRGNEECSIKNEFNR